jgi:antilisterial bacteriocin subtilosin biosynthesis protein AlbA
MTVANNEETQKLQAKEYYYNIKEKYPIIKDNLRIHHWPEEDLIFGEVSKERKASVLEKQTMTRMNASAQNLLKMCDGSRTTAQLIAQISQKEKMDPQVVAERMVKFLFLSENHYNHVRFSDTASQKEVAFEETGSEDYYTPIHFVLELTNRCNMTCKHCYRLEDTYEPHELSYEKIIEIIDQMAAMGARFIEVTGGEFTLHKRYLDVMAYLYEKMELIGLLTNGYTLNEEVITEFDKYRDKLLWSISLDSHDADYHDAFRGVKGSHKKICENIKLLRAHDHMVRISMSVTDENFDHLKDSIDFAYNELGASHFGFTEVMPLGRGAKIEQNPSYSLQEKSDKVEEIREYASQYDNFMMWYSEEEMNVMRKSLNNCGAGWKTLTIGPDGTVRPCVMMEEGIMTQGNIKENTIHQIMADNKQKHFDKLAMPDKDDCGNCFNGPYCRYCFYRGMLTNIERVKQGAGICEWGKKYGIDKFMDYDIKPATCSTKSCGL